MVTVQWGSKIFTCSVLERWKDVEVMNGSDFGHHSKLEQKSLGFQMFMN